MSRAVSIRSQLKKYMQRFALPTESCEGDAKRLRKCLVGGYWRNVARWVADGTYRSVRGNKVISLSSFSSHKVFICLPGSARTSKLRTFYPKATFGLGMFP